MHVSVIREAPAEVSVIALLAPVRTDLQQGMRHHLNNSPSPGSMYQMAAASRTLLLHAGMYKIHIGPQNKMKANNMPPRRVQGNTANPVIVTAPQISLNAAKILDTHILIC